MYMYTTRDDVHRERVTREIIRFGVEEAKKKKKKKKETKYRPKNSPMLDSSGTLQSRYGYMQLCAVCTSLSLSLSLHLSRICKYV